MSTPPAQTPPTDPAPAAGASSTHRPQQLVFRAPKTGLVVVVVFLLCAIPLATATVWLLVLLLIPLGAGYWLLRARTSVDGRGIIARGLVSQHALRWSEIRALRVSERGWVRAVRLEAGTGAAGSPATGAGAPAMTGAEIVLPNVRARHVPALAACSGGRLGDPEASGSPGE